MGYACQQSGYQHTHTHTHTHYPHSILHNGDETENFPFSFSMFKHTKCLATGKKKKGGKQVISLVNHMTKGALLTFPWS